MVRKYNANIFDNTQLHSIPGNTCKWWHA